MRWSKLTRNLLRIVQSTTVRLRLSDKTRARSYRGLNRRFWRPWDPDDMLEYAMTQLKLKGIRLRVRRRGLPFKLDEAATTWRKTIALPWNWKTMSSRRKAAILAHELVHVEQRRRYSRSFLAKYLNPRWRWAMEVQAYRQQLRTYIAMGASPTWTQAWCQRTASELPRFYLLGNVDRVRHWTFVILMWEERRRV